ncbi:DUF6053 domain-containing protein [Lysobacter enzymogenes]|uniref:DUF6053 domain-containing protein n=1 Tax=Lysobacter enzymogenes TaxID=69 RepID=UPI003D188E24
MGGPSGPTLLSQAAATRPKSIGAEAPPTKAAPPLARRKPGSLCGRAFRPDAFVPGRRKPNPGQRVSAPPTSPSCDRRPQSPCRPPSRRGRPCARIGRSPLHEHSGTRHPRKQRHRNCADPASIQRRTFASRREHADI